jgi:hypothetical protein
MPSMSMSDEQLADLNITKIHTNNPDNDSMVSLGFTWNSGLMEKWDNSRKVDNTYDLPTDKKIVKVDINYGKEELSIYNLEFFFSDGTSKRLGYPKSTKR